MLLNILCLFWFSLQILFETFLTLRRNERDIIKTVYRSACKVPITLSDFNEAWIFKTDFWKSSNIRFRINPCSGSRVLPRERTDGQTDVAKLIVASHNFAKAPEKVNSFPSTLWRNEERTELYLLSFLNLAVDRGEWLTSNPGRFTPGNDASNWTMR